MDVNRHVSLMIILFFVICSQCRYKHELVLNGDELIVIGGGWPYPQSDSEINEVTESKTERDRQIDRQI